MPAPVLLRCPVLGVGALYTSPSASPIPTLAPSSTSSPQCQALSSMPRRSCSTTSRRNISSRTTLRSLRTPTTRMKTMMMRTRMRSKSYARASETRDAEIAVAVELDVLTSFEKKSYREPASVTAMTESEVGDYRLRREITVEGKDVPKPIGEFRVLGFPVVSAVAAGSLPCLELLIQV